MTSSVATYAWSSYADIQLLLESGEISRAATLFSRYRETNALTDEAREVGNRIEAQQARTHFETAQRFTDLWLFDQAYVAINRALALRPDNQKFSLYINRIRTAERAAAEAELEERITVIEQLINDGYPESAKLLLDAIASANPDSGRRHHRDPAVPAPPTPPPPGTPRVPPAPSPHRPTRAWRRCAAA